MPKKIVLIQLGSFGDCLYVTSIARQIKIDFPGCHLTWAVGSRAKQAIVNNPDIDAIWEVSESSNPFEDLIRICKEAYNLEKKGEFHQVLVTQLGPDTWYRYDGNLRSSYFRAYPHPITCGVEPIVFLTDEETATVARFIRQFELDQGTRNILWEAAPQSGQSPLNLQISLEAAVKIAEQVPQTRLLISSQHSFISPHPSIIDASKLSIRENAALTHCCCLIVGGSSGISWLATSNAAKHLPMIQVLDSRSTWFNSLVQDHERWGLSTDNILEMGESDAGYLVESILTTLNEGFTVARAKFHRQFPESYSGFRVLLRDLLAQKRWDDGLRLIRTNLISRASTRRVLSESFMVLTRLGANRLQYCLGALLTGKPKSVVKKLFRRF